MKTPFAAPALTRAQIDAIVAAGAVHPDCQSPEWQSDTPPTVPRSQGQLQRDVIRSREDMSRGAQASVKTVAVAAAAYGCVDWYIYPDSHGESESASEAA